MKLRFTFLMIIIFSGLLWAQNTEDFESGDFSGNAWEFSGDADWSVTSAEAHGGLYSAQAGTISHSQATSISVTMEITDASPISFWWSTDSESNYDHLRFYIDEEEMAELSGVQAWTEESFDVAAGTHTFRWEYSKDGSVSSGQDTGWVDDITFPSTFTYDNDLACAGLTGPAYANVGGTAVYQITISNMGYNTISDYTVSLHKSDGEELASIDVNQALPYEENRLHSVPWNIPASEENNTVILYAKVTLANDENTGNNQSGNFSTTIFPPGVIEVSVGNGTISENRTPVSLYYANSLAQMLYFPDEIGIDQGNITSLHYQYNFDEHINDENITIWLGETIQADLSTNFISADQLTQVYSGTPNFIGDSSDRWVELVLNSGYQYNGGNLVVMVHNPLTASHSMQTNFIHDESSFSEHPDRTRYARDNVDIYDPYDPPSDEDSYTFEKYPNIVFSFYTGPKGNLEGFVTDETGNPVAGAEVSQPDLGLMAITDNQGYYILPDIPEGEHTFLAAKFGYENDLQDATIVQDETTEQDFTINSWPTVTLNGIVHASDDLDSGLSGCNVQLQGFADYDVTTGQSGTFTFHNVYANQDYEINVSHEDYHDYNAEVTVGSENLDLGSIILLEPTTPPGNVVAQQSDDESTATISWNSPGIGGKEFRYDDGEPVDQVGMTNSNAVLGAKHETNSVLQSISWYLTNATANHGTVKLFLFGLDDEGLPDQTDLLYNSGTIFNIDNQWNTHQLPNEISAPNGFFVGISTMGQYTDIALDDGVGAPYEYQNQSHYAIADYTDAGEEWINMTAFGYTKNMLIRAFGIEYGRAEAQKDISPNREQEGFNLYRLSYQDQYNPDNWDLIESALSDTVYIDPSWQSVEAGQYRYAVKTRYTNDVESNPTFSGVLVKTFTSTTDNILVPEKVSNYPNPFRAISGKRGSGTTIDFNLQNSSLIKINVYNIKGRLIKRLMQTELSAGKHQVFWDGHDDNSRPASSGVYFYQIETETQKVSKKMLLIK
ncbi:MAG: carboxypeptidase regulatory-like domain-containing protein [Candidatus Cloacimonadales bacterium]